MTTLANSRKGARRRASGNTIEFMFRHSHLVYRNAKRLRETKCHPPTRGAPGGLTFLESEHVDYLGAIAPTGRMLAIDVKGVTGETSFGPPRRPKTVTEKSLKAYQRDLKRYQRQVQLLCDFRDMGAVAAFLCVDAKRERCWLITELFQLERGGSVRFRDGNFDLTPAVAFSSVEAIARGAAPIDYLDTLLSIYP